MAFDRKNLSGGIGAGSNAPKLYTFKDTASTKIEVATADYFLSMYEILDVGDVILANCSSGTMFVIVTASTNITVTVEMLEITTA